LKRFLIISDIHACDIDPASPKAPSYVSSFGGSSGAAVDPISELERLVREEDLAPDYILCAGDITNRSNPAALRYAWERLRSLAHACGAKLIATVGNHDIDSRYKANAFDPRGFVMSLAPKIPYEERERFLEYWAENFTLLSHEGCNILILNTAAYHGGGKNIAAEIEHGRISKVTLDGIKDTLQRAPKASVNIVLCHHHLLRPEESDEELVGQTRGGEKLIQLLSEVAEAWIVIHGHKHTPDLFYGDGGLNAPVILACASFSAQINVDAQNKNPNQVHLLICDPDGARATGLTSAGTVTSWTWQPGVGWRKAHGLQGLRHHVGFGYRASVNWLVEELERLLTTNNIAQTSWADAVDAIPALQRLIPVDFNLFERALDEKGLVILTDRDGSLAQVGRRP
jgi:3',5'-cyclic AMP phosphodiesterase CpdA